MSRANASSFFHPFLPQWVYYLDESDFQSYVYHNTKWAKDLDRLDSLIFEIYPDLRPGNLDEAQKKLRNNPREIPLLHKAVSIHGGGYCCLFLRNGIDLGYRAAVLNKRGGVGQYWISSVQEIIEATKEEFPLGIPRGAKLDSGWQKIIKYVFRGRKNFAKALNLPVYTHPRKVKEKLPYRLADMPVEVQQLAISLSESLGVEPAKAYARILSEAV